MSDWLLGALFFLAVFNPAVLALLLARSGDARLDRDAITRLLPGFVGGLLVLGLVALIADGVLDALSLALSTFQIAAGTLIVFGALQAFLALGVEPEDVTPTWANIRLLVWMISPAPLALAISLGASDGFGLAAGALLAGGVVALALAAGWLLWRGLNNRVLLGWLRRLIAAAAVIAAIDLIRQGVENV